MFYKKITLLLFPLILLAAPEAPSDLNLTPEKNSVVLSWQDNSDNETGFKIFRNDTPEEDNNKTLGTLIAITEANTTTYRDRFLISLQPYVYTVKATDDLVLTKQQREIADRFVSIFENGTQEIQYTYAQNIYDNRGITAGRAGFTSATGDMLEVIKRYTRVNPDNPLATYIERLEDIYKTYVEENYEINDYTTTKSLYKLDGLMSKWHTLGKLQSFQDVQNQVVDEFYYLPSIQLASELKVKYPLTILALYDTFIQHGESNIKKIIQEANKRTKDEEPCDCDEEPCDCKEEKWYKNFLEIRKTKRDDSIERANALIDLNISDTNNNQLKPLTIYIKGKDYNESHYIPKHVYESAEDNTTLGWSFVKGDQAKSSITVGFEPDEYNRFIVIKTDDKGQYKLGDWNITIDHNFSWRLKCSNKFKISIQVETNQGTRYLVYEPIDIDEGINKEESYIYHGLGTEIQSNSWEYIERNLEDDIKEFEPENYLKSIKTFFVEGNVSIDEIASYK